MKAKAKEHVMQKEIEACNENAIKEILRVSRAAEAIDPARNYNVCEISTVPTIIVHPGFNEHITVISGDTFQKCLEKLASHVEETK